MKVQEANDLKVQNRQLMEENTRLTDLTRMLLSSQAFSGFLSELSGTTPSSSARNLSQSKARAQPQPSKKDINPHQMASQMQNQHQQNGMATIADQTLDFSMTDNASSAQSWNTGLSLTNFPVYALTSLPEGPSLDIGKLSGKADNGLVSQPVRSVKCDMPIIEHSPFVSCEVDASPSILNNNMHHHAVETEESALSLYAEPPSHSRASVSLPPAAHRSANPKSGSRGFGPTSAVADDTESAAAARLALMCSRLDALSERIAAVTSHLT
jgi:bZIP-type transcription factor MBZ1